MISGLTGGGTSVFLVVSFTPEASSRGGNKSTQTNAAHVYRTSLIRDEERIFQTGHYAIAF